MLSMRSLQISCLTSVRYHSLLRAECKCGASLGTSVSFGKVWFSTTLHLKWLHVIIRSVKQELTDWQINGPKTRQSYFVTCCKERKIEEQGKKISQQNFGREVWQGLYHVIKERNEMRWHGLFRRKGKIGFPSRNFVYCWLSAGEQLIYLSGLLQAVFSALPL